MPRGQAASAEYRELSSRLVAEGVPFSKVRKVTQIVHNVAVETREETLTVDTRSAEHLVQRARIIATRKLSLATGEEITLAFAEPAASLGLVLHHNAEVRAIFQETLRRFPCSPIRPWRIVLGLDECWSGNVLNVTGRKAMALSYTFMEFEKICQSREAFWFTIAIVESRVIQKLRGGWSEACRVILEAYFLDPLGGFAQHGMLVQFQDQNILLHAKIEIVLADGDGWRQLYEAKGASAVRVCPKCSNVVSRRDLLAHAPAATPLIDCSCGDVGKFVLHTFDSLHNDIKLLFRNKAAFHSGRMTNTMVEHVEKATGFSPTLQGVWGNSELAKMLNLPMVTAFDWVHCCLENGVLTFELNNYPVRKKNNCV